MLGTHKCRHYRAHSHPKSCNKSLLLPLLPLTSRQKPQNMSTPSVSLSPTLAHRISTPNCTQNQIGTKRTPYATKALE